MRKYAYLVFCILFIQTRFSAQITATPTVGCAPLVGVNFTGVAGSTNILWTFGDGTTSSLLNPVHTYANPGTYAVTYTATSGGGSINQNLSIKVYGKPVPSFTATPPLSGCVPLAVHFQDNSTGGGGSAITTWQWSYGDGGINSTNSGTQTYTYSVGGQFNVTIKVTDAHGCDSSMTIQHLINVSQKPTIVLTTSPNPPSACLPPLTVTFTSNGTVSHSTTSPTLTYQWNFGGGNTSSQANPPPQTWNTYGTFPIVLTVTDNNGCKDSAVKNVIIQNPFASFLTNDTVCMRAQFTSNSTGGSIYQWSFGDGGTGTGTIGTHTYTAPGWYPVKLTVLNGGCHDDTTINVYVEQPVANFSVTPVYMCSLPKVITLTNMSTPSTGVSYQWGFWENYTQYVFTPPNSTQTNPTFTITDIDTNRYTINHFDYRDSINLVVTTPRGCWDRKSILWVDSIYLPTARFMPDKYQGCVPLTVHFSDSSKSKDPINYWEYDFGDGSPHSIGVQNPVHTYTSTGIYWPTLIIHNTNGCIDTSYAIEIEVGKKPNANFSVSPNNICIGDTIHFTNLTPASDSVDTWHYNGDGGFFASACYNSPNSDWPFTHATGPQTISMIACFRGCCDTATQTGAVTVKGPLATFSTAMDCDSPMVYTLTGTLSDAVSWTWDFGDGNTIPNSTASVVTHSYAATGDYWVYLTAFNPGTGCKPSKDSVWIHVRNIKAAFNFDSLLCSSVPYGYDASPSQDVYLFGNNGYTWLWGDGTHPDLTATAVTSHTFAASGTYTITLIVKDVNGCADTTRKQVRAFSAQASFTSQATVCMSDTIQFTSTSTADTTITAYNWSFGDGGTSVSQNPSHIFNFPPSVNKDTVKLTITTALGCTSVVKKVLTISKPNATFSVLSLVNICAGDSVKFSKNPTYPGMNWTFGDGGTASGVATPVHHYTTAGLYTVSLTVTDSIGCQDTKINATVSVQNIPQVYITSPAFHTPDLCYPYQATFTDSSFASVFAYRIWNLGTGQTVNNSLSTVGTIYQTPGTYTISLVEVTTNGCKDSAKAVITVLGPVADFTLSPGTICKGQSINFNIKDTSDVYTWHWDFGDGKDTIGVSPVSHTYNSHPPGGTTNVTLVYWSSDSTCVQTKIYPINIYQVISDFKRNNEMTASDTAHCLGITDLFTNTSTNSDVWGWTFGDGSSSAALNPTHLYTAPGTYSVSLHIKNNTTGCVDTLVKTMVIFPPVTASASGDSICQGQSGHISASGGTIYAWSLSAGLNDTTLANPVANPTVTTTYTVIVTDGNGCKDTAMTTVYVQTPPVTRDTIYTMVIGQTCSLNGYAGAGYSYTWTPTTNLSCTSCPNPVCSSTVDITYTVGVTDAMGCFTGQSTFTVHIEPLSSIDVPTAFTPNGDGVNDVVYVAGWGIKKLLYFKIFNRWGELVFETDDITVGWDGTYRSVPQNTETYVYEAAVEPFIDGGKPVVKKGAIKLLR